MDNRLFYNPGAHLARRQPCAPIPAPAVPTTGTKASGRRFLWITPGLCQNYPQFYAPCASKAKIAVKNAFSAQQVSTYSYLFDSNSGCLCNQTPRIPLCLAPAPPTGLDGPGPSGSPGGPPSPFFSTSPPGCCRLSLCRDVREAPEWGVLVIL